MMKSRATNATTIANQDGRVTTFSNPDPFFSAANAIPTAPIGRTKRMTSKLIVARAILLIQREERRQAGRRRGSASSAVADSTRTAAKQPNRIYGSASSRLMDTLQIGKGRVYANDLTVERNAGIGDSVRAG